MQNIPQIVRERLKAGAAIGGHPGSDLLTAFAERSLSEPERISVLTHLAACGDCREIVALALPALDDTSRASARVHQPLFSGGWFTRPGFARHRFAWPAFRWGFVTAAVALLALGIVEFKRHDYPAHIVVNQVAPAPVATDLRNQTSSRSTPSAASSEAVSDKSVARFPASAGKSAGFAKQRRHVAQGELISHGNLPDSQPRAALPVQAPSSAIAAKRTPASSSIPSASQTLAVQVQNKTAETQSAASQVAQGTVPNSAESSLEYNPAPEYNSAPMSRAKPAGAEPEAGLVGAGLATSQWSITAVGGLERSLDQGKTWQSINVDANIVPGASAGNALGSSMNAAAKPGSPADQAIKIPVTPVFFRAVTAAGSEVWAGGSHAALFHSIDGGDHWTRILPSSSGTALSGDVIGIEFSDPQHGAVTTSTAGIWTTADDGQSWQKH